MAKCQDGLSSTMNDVVYAQISSLLHAVTRTRVYCMWHPGWGDSAESPLAKDAFEMLLSEAACCNMKALSER